MRDSAVVTARRSAGSTAAPRPLRPLLKWAGGKRWQVPHVRALWEPHRRRRLVEPFCGGMAITIGLAPDRALLNDVSVHLVNVYRWVQRGLTVTIPMRNDARTYYAHRLRFNRLLAEDGTETAEAAALFLYLNRTGYNGLCRFNSRGGFNVPFGRYRRISYRTDFSEYTDAFGRYEFTSTDFEAVPLRADDFVYADPPYDVEFTHYASGGFGWDAQERVARWLAAHPGPVVLSNQRTPRIVELYRDLGFTLFPLTAPRLISCTGDRTPAQEVLAVRNLET
jgi:DNA adenine methylase